jgi:hypothetical protein
MDREPEDFCNFESAPIILRSVKTSVLCDVMQFRFLQFYSHSAFPDMKVVVFSATSVCFCHTKHRLSVLHKSNNYVTAVETSNLTKKLSL